MSGVRIDVQGEFDSFQSAMQRLSRAEMKELNRALGEAVRSGTIDRFENSEDPEGNRWQNSIRVNAQGGKTLAQTARLRNSISVLASHKGFAVGTNVKYAAIHQFGGTIRARTARGLIFRINGRFVRKDEVEIPARPFLGISEEDSREIRATVEDYIGGLVE